MEKPISSHARTLSILKKYNMHAKKGFGQNFIIDPSIVAKIARLSGADKESITIEVGPGIGALTEQLALVSKNVIAFEIDPKCIEVLQETMIPYPNVEVIQQDFLTVAASQLLQPERKILCANLPYYVTTPILFHIFEDLKEIQVITVMVQKEVADRFNAKVSTKDYNALSLIVQYLFSVKIVMQVPKEVFMPRPNVDSSVVQFVRHPSLPLENPDKFFKLLKASFKQRRKTLFNNLREFVDDAGKLNELLEKAAIQPSIRAENLTLDDYLRLYEVLYGN